MNPIDEMITVNRAQKSYYEVASGGLPSAVNSGATNFWRRFRYRMLAAAAKEEHAVRVNSLHKDWFGDVSAAKVLDLGCGSGNPLSVWLAERSRRYVGIDLSESRVAALRQKLPPGEHITAVAADFLSDDFQENDFDVVYALAVFHHFKYLRQFCDSLLSRLKPGARVITYDPLQTWAVARCLRSVYRPFQTDRDWEHPFTAESIGILTEKFDVEACRGFYGKTKLAMLVGLLAPKLGRRMALRCFAREAKENNSLGSISKCLHASFLLRVRGGKLTT
jgi:SAM-dependent methyltransferase